MIGYTRRGRGLWGALVSAAILLSAQAALADNAGEADKHFRRGVDLYKDSDYRAALVEFQRAYDTLPSWQVLYNIGESQFQLQDYADALKTLTRYLDEGGKKVPARRRKEVERDIEKLKTRVAVLRVSASEPGATILIDDVPAGTSPLPEALVVSAGRRRVTATLGSRPPVTEVVQVAGGDRLTVSLTIPPEPPRQVQVVAAPQPVSIVGPVIAWVSTGAVAVGAVTTGILALGASADLKNELGRYPADAKAISSAHGKALAFSVATDVLSVVALGGAGVSIWLTVKSQRAAIANAKQAPAAPPKPAAPKPDARIIIYPNGVGLAGSF